MKINLNRKDLEKFYHLLDIKEVFRKILSLTRHKRGKP